MLFGEQLRHESSSTVRTSISVVTPLNYPGTYPVTVVAGGVLNQ